MHYDPHRADLEQLSDRLAAERQRFRDADPGSDDDLDSFTVIRELTDEFQERLGARGRSDVTLVLRGRAPRYPRLR